MQIDNLVTDAQFPLDGIEQIKEAVVSHIGSDTRNGLDIGQDVICIAVSSQVYKVSGVVDFDLRLSANGKKYARDNVKIATREKAVTEVGSVSVK